MNATQPTTQYSARIPGQRYIASECAVFMRSKDPNGDLSNMTFRGFDLRVNNLRFQCSEGLYQALKFPGNPEVQTAIAVQHSGMDAKQVAYANPPELAPERWDQLKSDAMALTLAVKLQQHPGRFGAALLATGSRPIVEKSFKDIWWGAKPDANSRTLTGRNVLGQLLTELRDQLAETPGDPEGAARRFHQAHNASHQSRFINSRPVEL